MSASTETLPFTSVYVLHVNQGVHSWCLFLTNTLADTAPCSQDGRPRALCLRFNILNVKLEECEEFITRRTRREPT